MRADDLAFAQAVRAVVLSWACLACGDIRSDTCALASLRQAIVAGTPEATFLSLSDVERENIALIRSSAPGPARATPLCSAVVLPGGLGLSAAHCAAIEQPSLTLPSGAELSILSSTLHPELDVLVHVLHSACGPLPPGLPLMQDTGALQIRDRLVLAGYGETELYLRGELRFVVEELAEVSAQELVVDGKGRSGACGGDSGGPLLSRDLGAQGRVAVAGILSQGDASCRGRDRYVRVDAFEDWLATSFGVFEPDPSACGALDSTGRCFDGGAVWCEADQLMSRRCPVGTSCGWSDSDQGYRCVAQSACRGDGLGACEEGMLFRCARGVAGREECPSGCRYQSNGAATCD